MKNMRSQLLTITILCILTISGFMTLFTIQTSAATSDAQVLSYRWYISPVGGNAAYDGDLVAVGEVENIGSSNIAYMYVIAEAYASNGSLLNTSPSIQPYGNNLAHGQKAPFYIDFANPEASTTQDNTYTSDVANVTVTAYYVVNSSDEPYQGLTVTAQNSTSSGVYQVVGTIQNTGSKIASQVRAVTTFYNSSGTVVSMNTTEILSSSLNPGNSVNFAAVPVDGFQGEITNYVTIVHVSAVVSATTNTPTTTSTPTPSTSTSTSATPTASTTEGTQDYTMIIIAIIAVVVVVLVVVVFLMSRKAAKASAAAS
jgi:hypothetical protein